MALLCQLALFGLLASATAIRSTGPLLGVRGGSLQVEARELADLAGIKDPEKTVAGVVAKTLGVSRGGSLDCAALELGEACGIENPRAAVVDAISASKATLMTTLRSEAAFEAALRLRGGSLDCSAHELADLAGVEAPEKEVKKAVVASTSYVAKALHLRGGSLDCSARELADLAGVASPEKEVKNAVAKSTSFVAKALHIRGGALDGQAAEQLAELCEIEAPKPTVYKTVKAAFAWPFRRLGF